MVVFVVLHVSAPYSRTDLKLELNSRIFVRVDTTLKLQMFLSCKYAALALPILALTSASVLLCLSVMLPRYVKAFTSSSSLPCSVTGFSFAVLILRILVLPSWILAQFHHTNADAVPRENEFGNQGQQPFSARQRLTDLIQTLQVWFGGNSTGWSCHVFTSQCINFFFRLME